jgi:hypothetical protein
MPANLPGFSWVPQVRNIKLSRCVSGCTLIRADMLGKRQLTTGNKISSTPPSELIIRSKPCFDINKIRRLDRYKLVVGISLYKLGPAKTEFS